MSTTITAALGNDFYQTLKSKFDAAVKEGSLIYTESSIIPETADGVPVLYTLATALAQKPSRQDNLIAEKTHPDKPKSPWINPEQSLLISPNVGANGKYMAVLNKFAVTKGHFLLVTNEFQRQEAPLSEDDLESTFSVLKEVNSQSGRRHMAFYNSGPDSGASVPHKHIQFVPVEPGFTPYPDAVIASKPRQDQPFKHGDVPLKSDHLTFAHYIYPVPPSHRTGEDLAFIYSALISRVMTMLGKNGYNGMSYNFVCTEEWMAVMPRTSEKNEGRSINSLGLVGMYLAKNEQDLDFFRSQGPNALMTALGLPAEEIDDKEPDETLGYTRY